MNKEKQDKNSAVCNLIYSLLSHNKSSFFTFGILLQKNLFYFGSALSAKSWVKKRTTRTRTNKKTTWWLIMYMATWYHLQWQEIIDGNIFKWTSWKIWIYVSNDEIKNIKNTVFEVFCPLNMPRRLYIVISKWHFLYYADVHNSWAHLM